MNWKTIKLYPDYEVSDTGLVKNKLTNKILKGYIRNGYRFVHIKNGKELRIHRLVAIEFIPNPKNLCCVNHIDENKENNNIENLEWCNHQYNNTFGTRVEKQAKAMQKKVSKYSLDNIFIEEYESVNEAGLKNNIRPCNISNCLKGRQKTAGKHIWKYV